MFEIYGRNNCIWCDRTKELLDSKGYYYNFHNIETSKADLKDFKYYFKNAKTVPQIMAEDGHSLVDGGGGYIIIGGYKELVEWLKHYTKD